MVFSRQLTAEEKSVIITLEKFVRQAHAHSDSHDYAHILTVCSYAIKIAKKIPDSVDPFICICGALLHDIGKMNDTFEEIHGLFGSSIAEEFLEGLRIDHPTRDAICRVVIRHTPTSMIQPETIEEKIVFDADCLDRLGIMGLIRGFVGKSGSMALIMNTYMERRLSDYKKLYFDASRELGDLKNKELEKFIKLLQGRLSDRLETIEHIFSKEGVFS